MTSAPHDIRVLTSSDDIADAVAVFTTAMIGLPPLPPGDVTALHEPDRTLGAFADGLEVIADELVPLLRQRGLFRHEYETTTLRGHFAAASGREVTVA